MEEAQFADRVIVMKDGTITADGTSKEIFSNIPVLESAGLTVPQTTELLYKLNEKGIHTQSGIISVEECVEALSELLGANQ